MRPTCALAHVERKHHGSYPKGPAAALEGDKSHWTVGYLSALHHEHRDNFVPSQDGPGLGLSRYETLAP